MSYQYPRIGWRMGDPCPAAQASDRWLAADAGAVNSQLAAVLDATLDGVFSIGSDWRFTLANQRALAALSVGPDVIGRNVLDVFPRLPEAPFWPAYQRVMASRVAESLEAYSISLNAWYDAHIVPIGDGITVFFRDIGERKAAEAALQASNEQLQHLLDSVPQMIWSYDSEGGREFYNRPWRDFTGVALGMPGGPRLAELVHPDDHKRGKAAARHSLATGEPFECEYRLRHHSGEYRWIVSRAIPHHDANGKILIWYGSCTDIHQRVIACQAQMASESLVRSLVEASADCIMMLDLGGRTLFANAAALRDLSGDLIGMALPAIFTEDGEESAQRALAAALGGGVGQFTAFRAGPDEGPGWWDLVVTPVPGADGQPERLVAIARNVTDQKAVEERVRWSATHDSLTLLPNRVRFQEMLDLAIERETANGGSFALLMFDLNDFKLINDTLGHDAGDELLRSFAERLQSVMRPADFVARLGGDEFAMILGGVRSSGEIAATTQRIIARLKEPHVSRGRLLDCQASIGGSLFPDQGRSATDLLKKADLALYAARSLGHGKMMLFEPRMRAEMQSRISMLSVAREALKDDLVVPFYQPKVDLDSGAITGFEALLRWQHPTLGIQAPETIAAAFEDGELAAEISDRMVERTIATMRRWLDQGLEFRHVAINAAAAEFRRGTFADSLLERLHKAEVPTHCLQVEVTETVFLGRGAEYVEQALGTLSEAGVLIALDDFGTGFASLSHLKQFPVDLLKIDRSFIRDLEVDPNDAAIIRAVIGLGHSLGIRVVAEGVETAAQHAFLCRHGCDFGQGYLFGQAAPESEIPALLSAGRRGAAEPEDLPASDGISSPIWGWASQRRSRV